MWFIEKVLAKLAAKRIAKKLDLQEGPMEGTKKWWKSKTIWGGVYVAIRSAYEGLRATAFQQLPDVPPMVDSLVGVIVGEEIIRGRISASQKIG